MEHLVNKTGEKAMRNDKSPRAFPNYAGPYASNGADGMSLRDYFASHALVGLGNWWPTIPGDHVAKAVWAYAMADAMLLVRENKHVENAE